MQRPSMIRALNAFAATAATALALAACGAEPSPVPAEPAAQPAPARPTPTQGPRRATATATTTVTVAPAPATSVAPETSAVPAVADRWAAHKGALPFVLGMDAGMAQAKTSGRPLFVFYTQHG